LPRRAADSRDAVGRAIVLALLLVGGLFIMQTWIATDLARGMHFAAPETAFYEISRARRRPGCALITILATVLASAIANAMAAQAAVARILFAMARDGKLPAILAKIHPRYKTPYVSTLLVAVISLLVGSVLQRAHRRS
jgi:amino acid transporter